MKLSDILKNIKVKEVIGNTDIVIDNLSQDTREDFSDRTLYFAVPGTKVDGHQFIKQAIEKGGVVVVCEHIPNELDSRFRVNDKNKSWNDNGVIFVIVDSVSKIMGQMVSNFYRKPSEKLDVIAVTGTNGKTTIATLIYQSFLKLGKKAALFSTAGDFINGHKIETEKKASSSMEIIELQKNLAQAVKEQCDYVCIEATSHALDQNRLNGTKIRGAIYTNLTQDHLDYHKNFDGYAGSKQKLFSLLDENSFALINIDDSYGAMMIEKTKAKILTYGKKELNKQIHKDYIFEILNISMGGTAVLFNKSKLKIKLIGTFNVYNMLSVYGSLIELGFNIDDIINVLSIIQGAHGRIEIVKGKRREIIGIVDYAHTPDAIENVLKTINKLPHNKIITVIGVGGDRDRKKRPQMAKIAQENSDYVIYTSDNPRTEDVKQIFNDLISGCNESNKNYEKIENRDKAIKRAVKLSTKGDIILIAGKGHEDYQIIGTEKIHFDDREVLEKYLNLK